MEKIDTENLKLLFQVTKDELVYQMDVGDKLNTKASTIMGFIGVIVGVIFGFTFYLKSLSPQVFYSLKISTLFLIISFIFALFGFKNEVYRYDPEPKKLVEKYLLENHEKTMETITYNYVESYEENKKKLVKKARNINISLYLIFLSLIILTFGIFWG